MFLVFFVFVLSCMSRLVSSSPPPRSVSISGKNFVDSSNSTRPLLLKGANVVIKGDPWLPSTEGDTYCVDTKTTTCKSFNKADAKHFQNMGWNYIRLGVTWAGAQPVNTDSLDASWVKKLHAILDLAAEYDLYVLLDMHQDAVGSANCGEGVPQWFSQLAVPDMIGKALYPLPALDDGSCGLGDPSWNDYSGQPDYNIKNKCCLAHNQETWSHLTGTTHAQRTLKFLMDDEGSEYYANYMRLLALAVKDKPAAFGIELMNEPIEVRRWDLYELWKKCAEYIWNAVPNIAVGVADTGEAALNIGGLGIRPETLRWLKSETRLFYAFHWYGTPPKQADAITNALSYSNEWDMPALLTEYMDCSVQILAEYAGIGWSYWHYSQYCDTYPFADSRDGTFGACITGWGSGTANHSC